MNRIALSAILASGMVLTAPACAQEKLPTELAGTGLTNVGMRTSVAPWSILVESQESDGAIKGKMNWSGRACQFKDLPFSGSYRDGVLEISAPETAPNCGAWTIKMKRTSPTEFIFEGFARTTTAQADTQVILKPR